jgi:hypothetical protein
LQLSIISKSIFDTATMSRADATKQESLHVFVTIICAVVDAHLW